MKKRIAEPPQDLRSLVGDAVFDSWLESLRSLVPEGRTHRLAVIVAGMLQQAASVAGHLPRLKRRGALVDALLDPEAVCQDASAYTPYDGPSHPLEDIVASLFSATGVKHQRVNARGDSYSIVPSAVNEYLHWFDMPWE